MTRKSYWCYAQQHISNCICAYINLFESSECLTDNEIFSCIQQPDTDQWAIEGFYIYYGPFSDQQIEYQRQMVLGSSVRHAVLSHLADNVAYSVRMQSYTAAGTLSQFSNTVVKHTTRTYQPTRWLKNTPLVFILLWIWIRTAAISWTLETLKNSLIKMRK